MTNTLNRPLLLETLAYIEAHPENWDQGQWALLHPDKDSNEWVPDDVCNTSFCFAGRALADSGFVPYLCDYERIDLVDEGETSVARFIPLSVAKLVAKYHKKTGQWLDVDDDDVFAAETKAAELLGISAQDAQTLFNGDNSLDDLREMVAHLLVHGNLANFDEE